MYKKGLLNAVFATYLNQKANMNSITQNKKNICFNNIIGTGRLRKNKKVGAPHVSFPVRAAGVDSTGVGGSTGINVVVNKLFFVTRFFVKHLEKQNIDLARHCSRDQNIQQDRHCQNHYLTMPCWHKLLVSQH